MKHISEIIPEAIKETARSESTCKQSASRDLIAKAWRVLQARKLVHSDVGSTEYRIWEKDLSDISEAELFHGMNKAKDFTGFFSLPVFRDMCRVCQEDLGLPDTKKAYYEACRAPSPKANHKWSHPAVYYAGVLTGWFELASFPEDQIYPRFKTFYAGLVDRVMKGEALDRPMMEALPERVTVILEPEENQQRMASLRASLNI